MKRVILPIEPTPRMVGHIQKAAIESAPAGGRLTALDLDTAAKRIYELDMAASGAQAVDWDGFRALHTRQAEHYRSLARGCAAAWEIAIEGDA